MHHHHNDISDTNEKKTLSVIIFTLLTMATEIFYGILTHSMALLADGWHMATHALALSLTYIAYVLIRKLSNSEKFPLGTEKIGTLTAYTSSIFLALTGIWIIIEALQRFFNPLNIKFNEAILIAIIGFVVNIFCIIIMESKDIHNHQSSSDEDYNFKAAYYHILADALTSIMAIIALVIGKIFNILYLDSLIGIVGGILILKWAYNLLKHTTAILIDMKTDNKN